MKGVSLSFFIVTVLTGCVSTPVVQSPSQLSPTHGYVFADSPKIQPSLSISSLQDGTQFDFIKRSDESSYGVWVPSGEYKLERWYGHTLEGYSPFMVKAGQITNLGSLVAVSIGDHKQVVLPVKHPDNLKKIEETIHEFGPFLSSKGVIEWQTDGVPKPFEVSWCPGCVQPTSGLVVIALTAIGQEITRPPINKQLNDAKTIDDYFRIAKAGSPPLTKTPGVDAAAKLFFGADLGQIRVRSPSGVWSAIDTGVLNTVTAVAVFGTQIVAGFDDGTIRYSEDSGNTWKKATALGQNFVVSDIDRVEGGWLVLSERQKSYVHGGKITDQIAVFQAKRSDFGDIARIKSVDITTPVNSGFARGEVNNGYYYFNTGFELIRLDIASMIWKSVSPPTEVSSFRISQATGVIAAYKIQGMFSKLFVSSNHGDTWTKYDHPPYVIDDIRFENSTEGRAVRMSMGAFSGTFEFLQYDRATDSWNKTVEAPDGCVRILPDVNHTARFCVTSGGNILRNENSKWIAEYSLD